MTAPWSTARWVRVLDRMELRQVGVGLRFHGPPLWLEVTMSGPDSDLWPAVGPEREWDWQSSRSCVEASALADAGAGDEEVLAVVSRYTVTNLVLNAVHEIGEWLRLDGRRLWAAHLAGGDVLDGNGAVELAVSFPSGHPSAPPAELSAAGLDEVAAAVAPSRLTYLPATAITYEAAGPVVTRYGAAASSWCSSWSEGTLRSPGGEDLVTAVERDVHRAVIEHEADRVCSAFRIDGERVWALAPNRRGGGDAGAPIALGITYAEGAN